MGTRQGKGRSPSRRRRWRRGIALSVLLGIGLTLLGAPRTSRAEGITFQGRLTGDDGLPAVGPVTLTLSIYDENQAAVLWREQHASQGLENGLFFIVLGTGTRTGGAAATFGAVFNGRPRFVEVGVNNDPALTPRMRLTDAGFAIASGGIIDTATNALLTSASLLRADQDDTTTGTLTVGNLKVANRSATVLDTQANLDVRSIRINGQPIINESGNVVGPALIRGASIPRPGFHSGFVFVPQGPAGRTLTHNLGDPDALLVDHQSFSQSIGINDAAEGIDEFANVSHVGAHWSKLSNTQVFLERGHTGDLHSHQQQVRIWQLGSMGGFPSPTTDSGWVAISPSGTITLPSAAGDPEDFLVNLQFRHLGDRLIHNMGFGVDFSGFGDVGGYWFDLKNQSISLHRAPQDSFAQEMRVRIWNYGPGGSLPPPDYDSGFVERPVLGVAPKTDFVHFHNLGASPARMFVDLTFKSSFPSTRASGIHVARRGIDDPANLGAHWHHLEENSIRVTTTTGDPDVDFYRVRIWVVGQ
ncbi:MAG: hypothetical protein HY722_10215 [Planctomycetes bacterium]|nr:hypothetical protein [Planctomycetota bacterium]